MLSDYIAAQIYDKFRFSPTEGQKKVILSFSNWLATDDCNSIFILNGYAGTGKTTVIAVIVDALKTMNIKPVLLAPTGRAAKVLNQHTNHAASTIHRKIYRQRSLATPEAKFSLDQNKEQDAIFIIDEASMISSNGSNEAQFGSGQLLDDLLEYVRQGKRCRIMFVGDSAQLPPIGEELSIALDLKRMSAYGDVVYETLDEVMRQSNESGISYNATMVREMLDAGIYDCPLFDVSFPDFRAITAVDFLEELEDCYAKYGRDDVIVITRSNKRAGRYNQGIRSRILCAEEEIGGGDMLMVVKNNYHFAERDTNNDIDFIANGDVARLKRIRRFEELYGFRFAEATLSFPDYDNYEMECKVLLDTLYSDAPSLSQEQSNKLFYAVSEEYDNIKSRIKRYSMVRESPYFNAVQIKFAYAVTAHKSQGGEWSAVFIDSMLFGDDSMTRELLRWLYTAITRASQRLYLVNFGKQFGIGSGA